MSTVPENIVGELRRIMEANGLDMISISRGGKVLLSRLDDAEPKPAADLADLARWCAAQWTREAEERGRSETWPEPGRLPADALADRVRESRSVDEFKAAFVDRLSRAVEAYGEPFRNGGGFRPSIAWLLRPTGWKLAAEKPDVERWDPDDDLPETIRADVRRTRGLSLTEKNDDDNGPTLTPKQCAELDAALAKIGNQ